MARDMKKFYLGSLIGVLLAYLPKMMATDSIGKIIYFIPDKIAEMLKLVPTDGFGKFMLVGSPTLWQVLILALAVGLILMFVKK